MINHNKESSVYIPDDHKKYDILPTCRKYNVEMVVWNDTLLNKIQKLTKMSDHGVCPYQRYKSYADFFDEMDNWIKKYPDYNQEIIEYKNTVIKMNNKDLCAIVRYIGESNWSFTKNKYYYVVMYVENDSWVIEGIIDNEEYSAFISWVSRCTNPIDLTKDLEIVVDPSNNLENEFAKLMKNI